ncbi:MAG: WbqC family protein [Pseudorhodoferax sp.]
MKRVAILQSNYIPWKGYFDMIAAVDEFILYDDMQYTRRDWRNRNQIKTPQGTQWLTVPVVVKGRYLQKIRETEVDGTDWAGAHWKALVQNYSRARHFSEVSEWLEPLYRDRNHTHLSPLNRRFIEAICNYLGISTAIRSSADYMLVPGKTERLANLCVQVGASEYISGPAARSYVDESVFQQLGIRLTWFDYTGYPEYPQLWGGFIHGVSILDLLFNCGQDARRHMKHLCA